MRTCNTIYAVLGLTYFYENSQLEIRKGNTIYFYENSQVEIRKGNTIYAMRASNGRLISIEREFSNYLFYRNFLFSHIS